MIDQSKCTAQLSLRAMTHQTNSQLQAIGERPVLHVFASRMLNQWTRKEIEERKSEDTNRRLFFVSSEQHGYLEWSDWRQTDQRDSGEASHELQLIHLQPQLTVTCWHGEFVSFSSAEQTVATTWPLRCVQVRLPGPDAGDIRRRYIWHPLVSISNLRVSLLCQDLIVCFVWCV